MIAALESRDAARAGRSRSVRNAGLFLFWRGEAEEGRKGCDARRARGRLGIRCTDSGCALFLCRGAGGREVHVEVDPAVLGRDLARAFFDVVF